jgi:hypothetical protein
MITIWHKDYTELERAGIKGIYSAYVRPHHWEGWWMFRAHPNRGDCCLEYRSQDKDDVLLKAEQWFKGEEPDGIYSASC